MSFCSQCGKEIPTGAKFCQDCGAGVDTSTAQSQRKQVFEGEIRKCPNCGEVLKSFVTYCPTCGCEIRAVKVSESVHEFTSKLELVVSEDQRVSLIRTFPIPNTKEDIFEFITLAAANIASESQKSVFDAWVAKFEQCFQKAKIIFNDSPDFVKIQEIYSQTQKRIKKERFVRNSHAVGNAMTKSGSLISQLFELLARNAGVICGIVAFLWAIRIDTAGGNSSLHELIGGILLMASACTLTKRDAKYLEFVLVGASGWLSFYLAHFLGNGSMLQLTGAVVLIGVAVNFFKKTGKKEGKEKNS